MEKLMFKKISKVIFILLIGYSFSLFAAVSGKIVGHVYDVSNKNPLPGANVFIEGTNIGAFTDADGYFSILNVPPGTYNVRCSMIGYRNMVQTNVVVNIDLKTTISFEMEISAIEFGEVIAEAKRPVVQQDISSSQMNIEAEMISTLPVTTVEEVVNLQAGIESGFVIRGSSANQVAFMVDGLSYVDERSNLPYTSISLSSIQELKIQTGGFNPEYDNVRSGVINVVTKEGQIDRYVGSINVRYSPPASKHFGISLYDPESYFMKPYLDDDVCWIGTHSANSPWDEYTRNQNRRFEGYNALSAATMANDDPSDDLTPAAIQQLYKYQHRRQGDITIPDYVVDLGFGGPVPYIGDFLGNLRFFASYRDEQTAFVIPLSRDAYLDNNFQIKFTSDITQKIKLQIFGMYGELRSASTATWETPSSGSDYYTSVYAVAETASSSTAGASLFVPGSYNPLTIFRSNIGAKLTHQLNSRSFYEIDLQRMYNKYFTDRIAYRDTVKDYEVVPGYFVDEFPYGYIPEGPTTIAGIRTDWMGFAKDRSSNATTTFKIDYTNQINQNNQIKAGFKLTYSQFDINSWLDHPKSSNKYYYEWYQDPIRLGFYIQDQLEYDTWIFNGGLRLDINDSRADWYDLELYDELLKDNQGFNLETEANKKRSKLVTYLSPRMGISHPISVNSKIYFNYGHFSSVPPSQYRFLVDRRGTGAVRSLGNPDIAFAKTVAYELGYEHSLFDQYLVKIASYYKDVSDQPDWTKYVSTDGSVSYSVATSNSYADIRGIELTLYKKYGNWLTGFINYTYHVSTSGYFGIKTYFENSSDQREYLRENPYISRPHPSPFARANIDLHTPRDFSILGLKPAIVGNWNMSIIASWQQGSYFTNTDYTEIVDAFQWKDDYGVDMKIDKTFSWKKFDISLFVDISNVFNIKLMSLAGFSDGGDYRDYLISLHMWWEEGLEKGSDLVGDVRDPDVDYIAIESTSDYLSVATPDVRAIYYDTAAKGYYQYVDGAWTPRSKSWVKKNVLDPKAYIDMPNISSLTYLNPRDITFGIKVNF